MADVASELARTLIESLEDKKADDILLLDLSEVCSFTDYFVICCGGSERTLQALADETRRKMKQVHSRSARTTEGGAASGWILLDYGDVIVHIFSPAVRAYYRLEELWSGGRVLLRIE
jgi:ribosome-associated protein